jgi:hypothetical protein
MRNILSKITAFIIHFCSWFKNNSAAKEQVQSKLNRVVSEPVLETLTKSPAVNKLNEMDLEERPVMSKNNKYLYPEDNFGKMEEGVVD